MRKIVLFAALVAMVAVSSVQAQYYRRGAWESNITFSVGSSFLANNPVFWYQDNYGWSLCRTGSYAQDLRPEWTLTLGGESPTKGGATPGFYFSLSGGSNCWASSLQFDQGDYNTYFFTRRISLAEYWTWGWDVARFVNIHLGVGFYEDFFYDGCSISEGSNGYDDGFYYYDPFACGLLLNGGLKFDIGNYWYAAFDLNFNAIPFRSLSGDMDLPIFDNGVETINADMSRCRRMTPTFGIGFSW